jgi:flagellar basal body P-ring formation protein FlgA
MKLRLLLLSITLYFPLIITAESFHDMSNIKHQVTTFLYSLPEMQKNKDTKITVHSIDNRLKLSKCDSLDFNLASGSRLMGKVSVRIICSAPKAWSFYIATTISRYDEIFVLNGSFSRGHVLIESDIYKIRKDLSKLPFGYITNTSDVIGKQLKRHMQVGRVLTPSHLRNPLVIKRGEIVALQRKTSGFMVSMKGKAMMDGAIGDRIRVKNSSSKRIIEGQVAKAGLVIILN